LWLGLIAEVIQVGGHRYFFLADRAHPITHAENRTTHNATNATGLIIWDTLRSR